jgi:hypothetical protein
VDPTTDSRASDVLAATVRRRNGKPPVECYHADSRLQSCLPDKPVLTLSKGAGCHIRAHSRCACTASHTLPVDAGERFVASSGKFGIKIN